MLTSIPEPRLTRSGLGVEAAAQLSHHDFLVGPEFRDRRPRVTRFGGHRCLQQSQQFTAVPIGVNRGRPGQLDFVGGVGVGLGAHDDPEGFG